MVVLSDLDLQTAMLAVEIRGEFQRYFGFDKIVLSHLDSQTAMLAIDIRGQLH
jgi:hypothetical protein